MDAFWVKPHGQAQRLHYHTLVVPLPVAVAGKVGSALARQYGDAMGVSQFRQYCHGCLPVLPWVFASIVGACLQSWTSGKSPAAIILKPLAPSLHTGSCKMRVSVREAGLQLSIMISMNIIITYVIKYEVYVSGPGTRSVSLALVNNARMIPLKTPVLQS